jgi:hypothetical protein
MSATFPLKLLKILLSVILENHSPETLVLLTNSPRPRPISPRPSQKHNSQAWNTKTRSVRVVEEAIDDLFRGLKQFFNALIGRIEL